MHPFQRCLGFLMAFTMLVGMAVAPVAARSTPMPDLGNPSFNRFWARADYPVADGRATRTFYFGPHSVLSCEEAYEEAPGGKRFVTYLDKARLELNNPSTGTVTGGLLAKELISGEMQFGDAEFKQFPAAEVPVAGDPVDSPAPTYASFAQVSSIEPGQNRSQPRQGQPVTEILNKAGQVDADSSLARYGVTLIDYRSELGHNIPNIFMDFFNQRGLVANVEADGNISFSEDQLIDWTQVMGLPIAEPFWAVVPVDGVSKWVLMQPYERRVVTYTPDNTPAFQVEMGNIGLHYKTWRHPDGTCKDREAAPTITVPDGKSASTTPRLGPWGTIFRVTVSGFTPNEPLSFWLTAPDGSTYGVPRPLNVRHPGQIQDIPLATDEEFQLGLWAITFQGNTSGHQAIAYFGITDRPPVSPPAELVPDGKSASINPTYGWQGTVFRLSISGFQPNEPLSFWLTMPDGSTSGVPRPLNVRHPGQIQDIPIYTNERFEPGLWAITFQGDTSGHQAIAYFRIIK